MIGQGISCPTCSEKLRVRGPGAGETNPLSQLQKSPETLGHTNCDPSREKQGRPNAGLVLGIVGLIAWIIPLIGFPVTITGLVFSVNSLGRREKGIPVAGVLICSIGILLSGFSAWLGASSAMEIESGSQNPQDAVEVVEQPQFGPGLKKSELPLSAATVVGSWVERDVFANDSNEWTGSAGVIGAVDGRLLLATNAHCLGLNELFRADADGSPEVEAFDLLVDFPSGKRVPVQRFGFQADEIDVAFLVVPSGGLQEGVDYITLPFVKDAEIEQGAAVVAVGSPLGLRGTQTFGRVSAVREGVAGETPYRFIQIDAAINPGNSGGPLFLSRDDRYLFIGINSMKMEGAEGLGFAIDRAILDTETFYWFDVDEILEISTASQ